MKALIVPNLLETIEKEMPHENYRTEEFLELCERIQGKIVELVFIGDDAFESLDNNYWLPNVCWVKVNG